jgi:hypothetical protein
MEGERAYGGRGASPSVSKDLGLPPPSPRRPSLCARLKGEGPGEEIS